MPELLLEKKLRDSKQEDEVRKIARVRTLTVLPRLGRKRKRSLLQFLHESSLIEKANRIVDLSEADLRGMYPSNAKLDGADLSEANLYKADLSCVDLAGVDLRNAVLRGANLIAIRLHEANLFNTDLISTNLNGANLREVNLRGADLEDANLSNVQVTTEQLEKTKSLKNAIMPDGSKHS